MRVKNHTVGFYPLEIVERLCYNVFNIKALERGIATMTIKEEVREQMIIDIAKGLAALGYTAGDKAKIASLFAAILTTDELHITSNTTNLIVSKVELGI